MCEFKLMHITSSNLLTMWQIRFFSYIYVRTRFIMTPNWCWVHTLKGPNNIICRTWVWKARPWSPDGGWSWCSYKFKPRSLEKSFSSIRSGRLWFLAFFLSPLFWTAYFSFYTSLYPFLQRPRVGSTFQGWYLSHQPIPKVVGGGCKSWKALLCLMQSIQWQ